eukprot:839858-Prymnesium_polylepis.2
MFDFARDTRGRASSNPRAPQSAITISRRCPRAKPISGEAYNPVARQPGEESPSRSGQAPEADTAMVTQAVPHRCIRDRTQDCTVALDATFCLLSLGSDPQWQGRASLVPI